MSAGLNLLGLPVDGLDPAPFLLAMRVSFVLLALLGIVLLARGGDPRRAARVVLAVGLAGHTLAWCATMVPLPNVYGANGSQDRENHLGWANVVALGFSPLHTFQVDHLHFEPVWPLITAAVAGFEVDRVAAVFQWMPLVVGLALLFSIRFVWGRGMAGPVVSLEAAFAALGAILLLATPQDFAAPFRNPWALTFLLKPNHALGLALVPLAALALARARDFRTRLFAGFVLQLIGWAFVIHMALFVAGLAVFVALSWLTGRDERARDLMDAGVAVGANLVLVSPYLFMLVVAYPFLSGDGPRVSPFSERFMEGPLRMGALFLVSALGAWTTYRKRGRLGRILAAQWLAAHIVWQAFPLLGLFGQAREQDEAFYWCRFWTGLFAGVGMFQGVEGLLARLRGAGPSGERAPTTTAAALSLALLLPSLLPVWWNPTIMDQYFQAARKPLPDRVAEPTRFIRENTPKEAVFAGDHVYARWIAAYGARRVLLAESLNLPKDGARRLEVENALLRSGEEALLKEGRDRYAVQYVLVTSNPGEQEPALGIESAMTRPYLEVVFDRTFTDGRVMIFKVVPVAAERP